MLWLVDEAPSEKEFTSLAGSEWIQDARKQIERLNPSHRTMFVYSNAQSYQKVS
jgi:hypothetical protein